MNSSYYETGISRIAPWGLIVACGVVGLWLPIVQSNSLAFWSVIFMVVLSGLGLLRAAAINQPVVILKTDHIYIRGVRPGSWKFFQLSQHEAISDDAIVSVKIGPPEGLFDGPAEPGRGRAHYWFLWVKYEDEGRTREIYYPHIKQLRDFRGLIVELERRYAGKLHRSEKSR